MSSLWNFRNLKPDGPSIPRPRETHDNTQLSELAIPDRDADGPSLHADPAVQRAAQALVEAAREAGHAWKMILQKNAPADRALERLVSEG